MSTKSSIILTNMNEHWYYEHSDDTFILEFDSETSECEELKDGETEFEVVLKKNSPLWKLLKTLRHGGTLREAEEEHEELR